MDNWQEKIRIFSACIVLGALSGVVSGALTSDYLSGYSVQLGEIIEPDRLQSEKPTSFPVSLVDATDLVKQQAWPATVQINNDFSGILLTSDGWVATVLPEKTSLRSINTISVDGTQYEIQQTFSHKYSDTVFLKIDARGLPVVAFGQATEVSPADRVFIVGANDFLRTTFIEDIKETKETQDIFAPSRILITQNENTTGNPVFNVNSELIGLSYAQGIIPIEAILPDFQRILEANQQRVSVGVSGAFEPRNGNQVFVVSKSTNKDIKVGDVITAVNGRLVSLSAHPYELIGTYSVGDTVRLEVERSGEKQEIELLLQ